MHLVVPPGGSFRETRRLELGPRPLTIGRGENCDVRVDVPGVDPEHARISEVAVIALGADCAIGDVPLDAGSRRLVMPGDEIQIGSIVVVLEGDDPSLLPPSPDGTHVRSADPKIRVVEGANFGDEFVLNEEGREYLVGRNASCALVLEDREVSREHLSVVRRGRQIVIRDLSSTRGSWLGRAAVYSGSTVVWSRPTMLRVGASVLALELPREFGVPIGKASAPLTPEPRRAPGSLSREPAAASPKAPAAAPLAAPVHASPRLASPVAAPAAPTPSFASGSASVAALDEIAIPGPRRTAWKKKGSTFGKTSGLLLLALAGLAILGGLFVVFSLLE